MNSPSDARDQSPQRPSGLRGRESQEVGGTSRNAFVVLTRSGGLPPKVRPEPRRRRPQNSGWKARHPDRGERKGEEGEVGEKGAARSP